MAFSAGRKDQTKNTKMNNIQPKKKEDDNDIGTVATRRLGKKGVERFSSVLSFDKSYETKKKRPIQKS